MNSFLTGFASAWLKKGMAAVLAGLLAGCASMAPSGQRGQAAQESPLLRAYQETVDMTGRLSIRYQENGSEQALHGSFTWSQGPERIAVSLLSPLGQTLAVIESTPTGAVLRQPGQPLRKASDVNELTAQALGWPLPVAGLRHWLQGFAMDANGLRAIASPAANAMPETAMRDGWHLRYANWNSETTVPHPKRLDLQRTTEQAGDVEIRLIIDSFQPL